jgi:hypothetical protein
MSDDDDQIAREFKRHLLDAIKSFIEMRANEEVKLPLYVGAGVLAQLTARVVSQLLETNGVGETYFFEWENRWTALVREAIETADKADQRNRQREEN